ncbi:hypothetical protein [Orbus mooreae]|uniref:hypothetical protein n=1 Tax=Orbus mooreae TaxID=3074107 RepID=UPI00370D7117
MKYTLPPDCGSALKNAPSTLQQKILYLLAKWPITKGQSTPEYSKALRSAIKKLIHLWRGEWLNPDELTQTGKLYIRCSNMHIFKFRVFHLHRGQWCPDCYFNNLRYSLKDIELLAKQKKGKCLTKDYKNSRQRLTWQCQYGHNWQMSIDGYQKGQWCPVCSVEHKQQQALRILQQIAKQQGGSCLSTTYTRGCDKYTFHCANGHEWQTTGKNIKNAKTWCPTCCHDQQRRPLAELQALALKRAGLCLAVHDAMLSDKVMWQCAQGHRWKQATYLIRAGRWCPFCARKTYTIEDMRQLAIARGGKCLSTTYKNLETKLTWLCHLGHTWQASPGHIKAGTWCPSCYYLSRCTKEESKQKYLPSKNKIQ